MAGISVRRIDDETYRKLQDRAKRHGVSMEEEVRRILAATVRSPEKLGSFATRLFGEHGVDLTLPERDHHEPVTFDR
jgi:plasmid stability protein